MALKSDLSCDHGEPAALSILQNEEELKDPLKLRTEFFVQMRKQFQDFKNTIPADLQAVPFVQLMDTLLEADESLDTTEEMSTTCVFKEPRVPRSTRRGRGTLSSRSVHWDQSVKNKSISQDENQVKLHNSSNDFYQTPQKSFKDAFAFVTPGPKMNKRVRVLRVPKEGETAVSLSGSPLLVAPFAPNKENQGTLIMTSNDGKTLAILKPPVGSPSSDSQLTDLGDDTKKKIHAFASYLLNSLEKKEKKNA